MEEPAEQNRRQAAKSGVKKENICPVVSVGRDRRDKLPLTKGGKGKRGVKKSLHNPQTHTHTPIHAHSARPAKSWLINFAAKFSLAKSAGSRGQRGISNGCWSDAGGALETRCFPKRHTPTARAYYNFKLNSPQRVPEPARLGLGGTRHRQSFVRWSAP